MATKPKPQQPLIKYSDTRLLKMMIIVTFLVGFTILGKILFISNAATVNYTAINNYTFAMAAPGVSSVQAQVNFIGSQTVNQLAPGAKLTYSQGVKSPKNVCYYVQVLPLKGGGTTATVDFTSPTRVMTVNLTYDPNNTGNFQVVCVGTGLKSNPGYNIYNRSPASGPALLVYQEVINF